MNETITITAKPYGTRAEHLAWCKVRALEYCDRHDPKQAMLSFASDMRKHDETKNHPALGLMVMSSMSGHLSTAAEMRKFIDGFN